MATGWRLPTAQELADLIDAAWPVTNNGNTASSNYTDHVWLSGVGKGLTVTPAKGDTGRTLFFPNAGRRVNGGSSIYGTYGFAYSATEGNTTDAWYLVFYSGDFGYIARYAKLQANSLRCVRS